ncbi:MULTISPECIES: ABC transporter permease [Streptomyces]|uniref:ABC transporter permease n=1 Tax=Streptomyces lycopersici TaxID=2974589 RepID=UPI0021D0723D|nr:ABC transporter permease subunit [Streptomyces sp. NEAU-383]
MTLRSGDRGTAPRCSPYRSRSGLTACAVLAAIALLALLGPWLAPHSPTEIVGKPYAAPGHSLLGTDQLGRDVLSRVLHGGRAVVLTAAATTAVGAVLGAVVGLTAALAAVRRPWLDSLIMRPLDALLAIPPLLLLLLFLSAAPGRWTIAAAVVMISLPLSARVVRAAAGPVTRRTHVEAAIARGERLPWLVVRELLPFVAGPLLADAAVRFVLSVYLVAAAGFLGLGTGTTDWGVQIADALPGAQLQPWALATPVLCVAVLAVAANVLSDELARHSRGLQA